MTLLVPKVGKDVAYRTTIIGISRRLSRHDTRCLHLQFNCFIFNRNDVLRKIELKNVQRLYSQNSVMEWRNWEVNIILIVICWNIRYDPVGVMTRFPKDI